MEMFSSYLLSRIISASSVSSKLAFETLSHVSTYYASPEEMIFGVVVGHALLIDIPSYTIHFLLFLNLVLWFLPD